MVGRLEAINVGRNPSLPKREHTVWNRARRAFFSTATSALLRRDPSSSRSPAPDFPAPRWYLCVPSDKVVQNGVALEVVVDLQQVLAREDDLLRENLRNFARDLSLRFRSKGAQRRRMHV